MGRRKTSCQKVDFSIVSLLPQKFESTEEDEVLITAYRLRDASSGLEQIAVMKELQQKFCSSHSKWETPHSSAIDVICQMYLYVPCHTPLKRCFHTFFQQTYLKDQHLIVASVSKSLVQLIETTLKSAVERSGKVASEIAGLFNSSPFGKEVVSLSTCSICDFLSNSLKRLLLLIETESCPQRANGFYVTCHEVLSAVTLMLQNLKLNLHLCLMNEGSVLGSFAIGIFSSTVRLLEKGSVVPTCRITAAIALATLLKSDGSIDFTAFMCKKPISECLVPLPALICLPVLSQISLWNSIMAVLSFEELVMLIDGKLFLENILDEIIHFSETSKDSDVVLYCARAVLRWTVLVKEVASSDDCCFILQPMFCENSFVLNKLVQYVLFNLGHFIDCLRYTAREIFENIISIYVLFSQTDIKDSIFLKKMSLMLLNMPSHYCGKYGLLCCLTERLGASTMIQLKPTLPEDLYKALGEEYLASHVSEYCKVVFKRSLAEMERSVFENLWLKPLCLMLSSGSKEQRRSIIQHLLKLLAVVPDAMDFLISELSHLCTELNYPGSCFGALITCVKLSKNILISNDVVSDSSGKYYSMSETFLERALCHQEDQVRLAAYGIICDEPKSTKMVAPIEFKLLKQSLPWNICCQCPAFRQQLLAFIKKFLTRLKESYSSIMRNMRGSNEYDFTIDYKSFLDWLKKFLVFNLHPGANFPRRLSALHLLHLVFTTFRLSSGQDTDGLHLCVHISSSIIQTVFEALWDTYENNKELALDLLKNMTPNVLFPEERTVLQLCKIVVPLLSSTRLPDSSTASYLLTVVANYNSVFTDVKAALDVLQRTHQWDSFRSYVFNRDQQQPVLFIVIWILLEILNQQLSVARRSLVEAAVYGPMYGVLTCIRRVVAQVRFESVSEVHSICQWQQLINDLISLCFEVATIVAPVVCSSSPEGHLPVESERADGSLDGAKTYAVRAQVLLLCSWRTHKEVSLLFGEMTEGFPVADGDLQGSNAILSSSQLLKIGHFFIQQLGNVKHRGAFEQAYVGFHKLCYRIWRSNVKSLYELPEKWLNELFSMITGKSDSMTFCSSRRSAGLPYMMQALLVSEPEVNGSTCLRSALKSLLDIATKWKLDIMYSSDCQVHALNILRALYQDASLGEMIVPFISDGTKAAILGFKSPCWAVRNASTLLFSALITRTFGVSRSRHETQRKNCLTGRVFFSRFPDLYQFLLTELQCGADRLAINSPEKRISSEPTLCPVLLILSRLYPSPLEGNDSTMKLSSFVDLLFYCAGSSEWKIRVLAARALLPLLLYDDFEITLGKLFGVLASTELQPCHNKVHGTLLQVLCIVKEFDCGQVCMPTSIIAKLPVWIESCRFVVFRSCLCFEIRSVFVEILYHSLSICSSMGDECLQMAVLDLYKESRIPYHHPGKDRYLTNAVVFFFAFVLKSPVECISTLYYACSKMKVTPVVAFQKFISYFLSSCFYEVRLATLSVLVSLLDDDMEMTHSAECILTQSMSLPVSKEILDSHKALIVTALDSMLDFVVQHAVEVERHFGCMAKVFQLLCLTQNCHQEFLPGDRLTVAERLSWLLDALHNVDREDVMNAMLVFSGNLAVTIYENLQRSKITAGRIAECDYRHMQNVLLAWIAEIELCAHSSQSAERRRTALQVLNRIKHALLTDVHHLLGAKVIPLWQTLLVLLTDDEPDIRNAASDIVYFLKELKGVSNHDSLPSTVSTLALYDFIGIFVEHFQHFLSECISTLLEWMLSCSFGQEVQNDEQPFDKGEMNAFAEDLTLTHVTYEHLCKLLPLVKELPQLKMKKVHALCSSDSQAKEMEHCSVEEVILLCVNEIHCVLKTFEYSPFLNRQFEKDVQRISQFAHVIVCFWPFVEFELPCEVCDLMPCILKTIEDIACKNAYFVDIQSKLQKCCVSSENKQFQGLCGVYATCTSPV